MQNQFTAEKSASCGSGSSSLTQSLRERERALARNYADLDLQVVTAREWREAEVDVEATPDDLFPVFAVRACLSKHVQLFAWHPGPVIRALETSPPALNRSSMPAVQCWLCADADTLQLVCAPGSHRPANCAKHFPAVSAAVLLV